MTGWEEELRRRAARREAEGLVRRVEATEDVEDGSLDLAGNDYLGLRRHPTVLRRAEEALRAEGAGSGASRLVSGTRRVHETLEARLVAWTGAPTALVTSSGYAANLATLGALADSDTLIVSDAHAHASLIDAARLCRGEVRVVPHNDIGAVARALAERRQKQAVVVTESVFSVLGDAGPVRELAVLAREHDALLVVDEAHGLGVIGPGGAGAVAGLMHREHVVVTTSFGKSLASQGGAVLATGLVREQLINAGRAFIFDTALAPPNAGAALGALEVIAGNPGLSERLRVVAGELAGACGVPTPHGAVLSVPMPSPRTALAAVATCAERGVRVGCFRPPSTPDAIARLRITAHADLDDDRLARACAVLADVTGAGA